MADKDGDDFKSKGDVERRYHAILRWDDRELNIRAFDARDHRLAFRRWKLTEFEDALAEVHYLNDGTSKLTVDGEIRTHRPDPKPGDRILSPHDIGESTAWFVGKLDNGSEVILRDDRSDGHDRVDGFGLVIAVGRWHEVEYRGPDERETPQADPEGFREALIATVMARAGGHAVAVEISPTVAVVEAVRAAADIGKASRREHDVRPSAARAELDRLRNFTHSSRVDRASESEEH